jgi:hypothetical protein
VQTSIDGFRIISQRSKQYAGMTKTEWCGQDNEWKDVWLNKQVPPAAARVGVLRKGFSEPLYAVAVFDSYCPRYADGNIISPLWKSMPEVMIAKCAEALARRQAFPEDLSGLYTDDEMEQADAYEQEEAKTEKPIVNKVEDAVVVEIEPLDEQDLVRVKAYYENILRCTQIESLGPIFRDSARLLDAPFSPAEGKDVMTLRDALTEQAKYIRANQSEGEFANESKN